jgi:uncharacterized protein (TIGR03435 family)
MALLLGLVLLIAVELPCDAQAQSPSDQRPARAFEVASVKENRAPLDRQQALRSRVRRHPAGHVEASRVTLRQLIMEAYGVRPYQVVDTPPWVQTDHFDIDARAPVGAGPADTGAMLLRLLEDRFGLMVRSETRQIPTYALDWADGRRRLGSGIRRPSPGCESVASQRTDQRPAATQTAPRDGLPECRHAWGVREPGWVFVRYGPVDSLLTLLSSSVGRPVIDQTGLTGLYDIDLRFSPEIDPLLVEAGEVVAVDAPSMFSAVREQLGLQLRPRNSAVDVLAIVRAQRPSAN